MSAPTRQAQPLVALVERDLEDPLVARAEVEAAVGLVHERGRQEGPGGAQRPQGGPGGPVAAAQGPVGFPGEEAGSRGHRRGRRLGPRALAPQHPPARQVHGGEAPPGDERPIPVDDRGQGARDTGVGLPAHGAGSGLEAPQRAVLAPREQEPVRGAEAAGEALGLPRRRPGLRLERAHGAVAGGHVDAAAVGGQGRGDEVAEQRLPGRGEGEERGLRGHALSGAAGEE